MGIVTFCNEPRKYRTNYLACISTSRMPVVSWLVSRVVVIARRYVTNTSNIFYAVNKFSIRIRDGYFDAADRPSESRSAFNLKAPFAVEQTSEPRDFFFAHGSYWLTTLDVTTFQRACFLKITAAIKRMVCLMADRQTFSTDRMRFGM